ncbi:MAG: hypothetical protein H6701_10635 [Myxococcales bacterium]|nr:hypothetical protein [Myxococcales bacterium]
MPALVQRGLRTAFDDTRIGQLLNAEAEARGFGEFTRANRLMGDRLRLQTMHLATEQRRVAEQILRAVFYPFGPAVFGLRADAAGLHAQWVQPLAPGTLPARTLRPAPAGTLDALFDRPPALRLALGVDPPITSDYGRGIALLAGRGDVATFEAQVRARAGVDLRTALVATATGAVEVAFAIDPERFTAPATPLEALHRVQGIARFGITDPDTVRRALGQIEHAVDEALAAGDGRFAIDLPPLPRIWAQVGEDAVWFSLDPAVLTRLDAAAVARPAETPPPAPVDAVTLAITPGAFAPVLAALVAERAPMPSFMPSMSSLMPSLVPPPMPSPPPPPSPQPPPPPPDGDGDGVPDDRDACPAAPGPADGCPAAVQLDCEAITLAGAITFAPGAYLIEPRSEAPLDALAAALAAHPEIEKVDIAIRVDADGARLAGQRGYRVRQALVTRGVDKERLGWSTPRGRDEDPDVALRITRRSAPCASPAEATAEATADATAEATAEATADATAEATAEATRVTATAADAPPPLDGITAPRAAIDAADLARAREPAEAIARVVDAITLTVTPAADGFDLRVDARPAADLSGAIAAIVAALHPSDTRSPSRPQPVPAPADRRRMTGNPPGVGAP